MKMKRALALVLIALSLALCGCSILEPVVRGVMEARQPTAATPEKTLTPAATPVPTATPAPETVTVGRFDGNVYSNSYFGLTIAFPDSWTVATREQMAETMKLSQEMVGDYNEDLADSMRLSQERVIYCFLVTGPGMSTINMNCTKIYISGLTQADPDDFLSLATLGQQSKNLPITFGDITSIEIGGREFALMAGEFDINGVKGVQRYYCTISKGYAMLFAATASTESGMDALTAVINSAEFQ